MLAAGVVLIAAQALLLAAPTPLALGHALTFYAVALWSRTGAAKSYELLRIGAVRAAFVPWCLLAGALPLVGAQATLCNTFGIAAALAFDAAVEAAAAVAQRIVPGGGGGGHGGALVRAASAGDAALPTAAARRRAPLEGLR